MLIRLLICCLLLTCASTACADPILLFLLRMARDKAISASLESGYNTVREPQGSTLPSPVYGFVLPTPPIPHGGEEGRVRTLIDESFLHLSPAQRQAVFAGMQKILGDPTYAQIKPQIVAEFTLKANAVRESYLNLNRLSAGDKRALVMQAREEFRQMSEPDRQELLKVLQTGALPIPRDLNDSLLVELGVFGPGAAAARRE
jgi:hypothetical protein